MGLNPFLTFYIDVDAKAKANVKCEHSITVICCWMSTRVFRKYTKLAMLLFLYCLRGEEQIIFSKKVPLVGIKPGTSCGPL